MEDTIDDEQLVHLISNLPELYDPKNPSYKLQAKKEHAWKTISDSLNKNAAACKKRWKNIRDNYYKQKKGNKKPTGSAGSGHRKRNPILDQLGFLDAVEHERRVLTNTDAQRDQNTEADNNHEPLIEITTDESMEANNILTDTANPRPNLSTPDKPMQAINKTTATNIQSSINDTGVPPQKRKKDLSSQILSAISKGNSEREVLMSQLTAVSSTPPPEDEIDTLFRSLAITVKAFPPLLRAETKSKIFRVISDAEIQLLRPITPGSRLSSYSHETSTPLQSPVWDQADIPTADNQQADLALHHFLKTSENFN